MSLKIAVKIVSLGLADSILQIISICSAWKNESNLKCLHIVNYITSYIPSPLWSLFFLLLIESSNFHYCCFSLSDALSHLPDINSISPNQSTRNPLNPKPHNKKKINHNNHKSASCTNSPKGKKTVWNERILEVFY